MYNLGLHIKLIKGLINLLLQQFLEGLGLEPQKTVSPKTKITEGCKNKKWKLPNKVLKMFPFTHLPKELRLRNFSFQPSSRLEAINAEKIAQNWSRLDSLSPAYPVDHRRYLSFIPKDQTFRIVNARRDNCRRRVMRNLAPKKCKFDIFNYAKFLLYMNARFIKAD